MAEVLRLPPYIGGHQPGLQSLAGHQPGLHLLDEVLCVQEHRESADHHRDVCFFLDAECRKNVYHQPWYPDLWWRYFTSIIKVFLKLLSEKFYRF